MAPVLALPQGVFNTGNKGLPRSLPVVLGQAGVCSAHSPSLELTLPWAVPRTPGCAGIHREHQPVRRALWHPSLVLVEQQRGPGCAWGGWHSSVG